MNTGRGTLKPRQYNNKQNFYIMSAKTRKIIFWTVVAVLVIGLGFWLKYASFGVTVVTVIVGLAGIAAGWTAHILYGKYIREE